MGDLVVGDILEVSGFRGINDEVEALYLERKLFKEVEKFEVRGQIRGLGRDQQLFSIGSLTVRYGSALLDDLDSGLEEGLLVEVEDGNRAYTPQAFEVPATKVEGEHRMEFRADDEVSGGDAPNLAWEYEVAGRITALGEGSAFFMEDLLVVYDASTLFEGGTPADIDVGSRVKVRGRLRDADTLDADRIRFPDNDARVTGVVDLIDLDTRSLIVLGVGVDVADEAEIEDDRDGVEPFGLEDLMIGDVVELEGSQIGDRVRALELAREDDDRDSLIRGVVESFDAEQGVLTVLAVEMRVDGNTRYEGPDDAPITREAFFGALHANQTEVKADWNQRVSDASVPVDELSLED